MRRLGRRALYGLAVVVVVAGALELACRAGLLPSDPMRFRGKISGAPGERHLLLLGDSFSTEDARPKSLTFGNQLRSALTARGVGTVNLAVPGDGPGDAVERWVLFDDYTGQRFRPDVVLFDYYVGNDLTDTLFRLHGGTPKVLPAPSGVWRHLWLARLIQEIAVRRGWLKLHAPPGTLPPPNRAAPSGPAYEAAKRRAVNHWMVDVARHYPHFMTANLLVEGPLADEGLRATFTFLHELKRRAEARGAQLVIAIFPSTLQVSDSHTQFFSDLGFILDPRMRTEPVIQRRLLDFCAYEKLLCIDLLPTFREHAATEAYMPDDDHWLTEGHTLAAQTVEAALVRAGLLGLRP